MAPKHVGEHTTLKVTESMLPDCGSELMFQGRLVEAQVLMSIVVAPESLKRIISVAESGLFSIDKMLKGRAFAPHGLKDGHGWFGLAKARISA